LPQPSVIDTRIAFSRAREVLDSRGSPTVEADVMLVNGSLGRASVPSGSSAGKNEAIELRDGGNRYGGDGVLSAVANVTDVLGPGIVGLDAVDQRTVDLRLIELDGTPDKQRLGGNAILAVSMASCQAAAAARGLPLYRHIADLAGVHPIIPLPMVNIISGRLPPGSLMDIQDVMAIPTEARSFSGALEHAWAIHAAVGDRLQAEGFQPLVADEGGWAPQIPEEEALSWIADAINDGAAPAAIAIDVAATHFFWPGDGYYHLQADGAVVSARDMVELLKSWVTQTPLVSIEDGLAQDDWRGWRMLTAELGQTLQLIGDDLFTTNLARLNRGIEQHVANAVAVKLSQAGTVTESLAVVARAKASGYRTVVSARAGETEDTFLADFAVGSAAGQIRVGSVTRSSRLAKWNQLLRIEEDLGPQAYVGGAALLLTAGTTRGLGLPRRTTETDE
jgi:enolase